MAVQLWTVLCAVGLLVLRAGMAVYESGMVRAKNSATAVARQVIALALALLAFAIIGAPIFFGAKAGAIHPVGWLFVLGAPYREASVVAFFAIASTLGGAIVSGALAERSRASVSYALSILFAAIAFPVLCYWSQLGWLQRLGAHDAAGAGFIHLAAAAYAAAGAIAVGPRMGKYNRDGSSNAIPAHNMPLAGAGVLLVLAGWPALTVGFASAWREGLAVYNTLLAGAGGIVGSAVFSHLRYGKVDLHLLIAGLIGALAAICAGADIVWGWGSLIIGLGAGVLVPLMMLTLDMLWRVDDPVGAISMHGVGAIWGLIATPVFAGFQFRLIPAQLLLIGVVLAVAWGTGLLVLLVMKLVMPLRAKEADEFDGLDLADHDVAAYPDFQQTTIKSYHLREA